MGRKWSGVSFGGRSRHEYAVKTHTALTTHERPITTVKVPSQEAAVDVYMPKDSTIVQAEALLGPPLTKYILDQSSKRVFGPLGIQQYHIADRDSPLAYAVMIAERLAQVEDRTTIQAWFAGKNRFLGGRAPATAIVTDVAAVHRAARRFLAQG